MAELTIRKMQREDETFVSTCLHVGESVEIDRCAARRGRDVCREFGDRVALREYCADGRATLLRHQIPRGISVDGSEIGWGHEAPKEGIRAAIRSAVERTSRDFGG